MGYSHWIAEHLFELIQTFFGGGIFLFAYSIQKDTKSRRVANLIAVNQTHSDTDKLFHEHLHLERIFHKDIDLMKTPISLQEERITTQLILNLNVAYQAMKSGELIKFEGLQKDVAGFFILPIPKSIWENIRHLQDRDFVLFVESALK